MGLIHCTSPAPGHGVSRTNCLGTLVTTKTKEETEAALLFKVPGTLWWPVDCAHWPRAEHMSSLRELYGYLKEVCVCSVGQDGAFNLMFLLNTHSMPHSGQASLPSELWMMSQEIKDIPLSLLVPCSTGSTEAQEHCRHHSHSPPKRR